MTFSFNSISYADHLQKLEATSAWLASIGIQTKNTRFDEVLRLNQEIVQHQEVDLIKKLTGRYGNLKLWLALTEAASFIEIYEAFQTKDRRARAIHPRAKLKKMLFGPYYSWEEDVQVGNSDARNTLFELEGASTFKRAGAVITGFDDIDFIFNKTKFNVQCKRLHSQKMVEENISLAATQFSKRMRSNLKGIICLCIDKLTGQEQMLWEVKFPRQIQPGLTILEQDFRAKYRTLWQDLIKINILAVLIFIHIVAKIQESPYPLLTVCRDIAFDVIPQPTFIQKSDYDLILELAQKIMQPCSI